MNTKEIYQALKKQGYNATTIAEALDVRPQSVATVIREGRGSKRIAQAVALASEIDFETMFPFYQKKSQIKAERANKIKQLRNELVSEGV